MKTVTYSVLIPVHYLSCLSALAGRLADDIEMLSDEAAVHFAILQLKRILPTASDPVCTSS
jgi:hypothetical protein